MIRSPDGSYYSEYSTVNKSGKRVSGRRDLDSANVEDILTQLSETSLPVSPEFPMVHDGEDVEVEIRGRFGMSKYTWFGAAPEEWKLLDEIAYTVNSWSGIDDDKHDS